MWTWSARAIGSVGVRWAVIVKSAIAMSTLSVCGMLARDLANGEDVLYIRISRSSLKCGAKECTKIYFSSRRE